MLVFVFVFRPCSYDFDSFPMVFARFRSARGTGKTDVRPTFAAPSELQLRACFATQRFRGLSWVAVTMPAPMHTICWNVGLQDSQLIALVGLQRGTSLWNRFAAMGQLAQQSKAHIIMFQDPPHSPSAEWPGPGKPGHYPLARPRCPAGRLRPASYPPVPPQPSRLNLD